MIRGLTERCLEMCARMSWDNRFRLDGGRTPTRCERWSFNNCESSFSNITYIRGSVSRPLISIRIAHITTYHIVCSHYNEQNISCCVSDKQPITYSTCYSEGPLLTNFYPAGRSPIPTGHCAVDLRVMVENLCLRSMLNLIISLS